MKGKNEIIKSLTEKLYPLPFIYAFWLEGADAIDNADEYSDLDLWVDFDDDYEHEAADAVENALQSVSEINFKYIFKHGHPKIRQRIYHLKDTSEYLLIDFCWQLHSRPKDEYAYFKDDKIESAKIIFDKDNIIRFKEYSVSEFKDMNLSRLEEARYRYSQHPRVVKYVYRKQYLEAYAYYNRYILEPLVDLLRLIYTPAYAHFHLIHISQHIPVDDVLRLEYFAKISSLEDIAVKIPEAQKWFDELLKILSRQSDR